MNLLIVHIYKSWKTLVSSKNWDTLYYLELNLKYFLSSGSWSPILYFIFRMISWSHGCTTDVVFGGRNSMVAAICWLLWVGAARSTTGLIFLHISRLRSLFQSFQISEVIIFITPSFMNKKAFFQYNFGSMKMTKCREFYFFW